MKPSIDANHHAATLDFKQTQLRQIESKLESLNHLRKAKPGQLVLKLHRRRRATVDDVLTEDVGQNVQQLLGLKASECLANLSGLATWVNAIAHGCPCLTKRRNNRIFTLRQRLIQRRTTDERRR